MTFKYLTISLFIGLVSYQSAFSNISDLNPFQCVANSKKMNCPVEGKLVVLPQARDSQLLENGDYSASWNGSQLHIKYKNRSIFQTVLNQNFLAAAKAKMNVHEARGSFTIDEKLSLICPNQVIEKVSIEDKKLILEGRFSKNRSNTKVCPGRWDMKFDLQNQSFVALDMNIHSSQLNRIFLNIKAKKDEHIWGFGLQYSSFNLKGKRLPVYVEEQGIGRGLQPISLAAELTQGKGVAGNWYSSYGSIPYFVTSNNNAMLLENSEYSVFDMRDKSRMKIELSSKQLRARIYAADNLKETLKITSDYTGRMKPLPHWMDNGVVIGMQGGTKAVREAMATAEKYSLPVSSFWLQDWVGKRKTSFGSQLWWNWILNDKHYPEWKKLVEDLSNKNVAVMTYINPFLVDTSENKDIKVNLFKEAKKNGYLALNEKGDPYLIPNTSFSAGILDLTNREARDWIKEIIKSRVIAVGAKGWMADFGEALPFDAKLANASAASFHNEYPQVWAKINRDAIKEEGLDDEIVFFSRSAYTKSPGQTKLFWLGDQLVTWDDKDGIKTAVIGLLSSGLSGFSLNHSDIGGYTTITNPIANYHRSKELLLRWIELSSMNLVMRTHEGNQPEKNHQWNSDEQTIKHFAKFARIHKLLAPYRRKLMDEAYASGVPVVRPMALEFEDPLSRGLVYQFMLGSDLLVAPVLDAGKNSVRVYLPTNDFRLLSTSKSYNKGWHIIAAPIGKPAIFIRENHDESIDSTALKESLNR